MIIRKFGIELQRLRHEDIELVRDMRNRPEIRMRMHNQHYITRAQQEEWFQEINNQNNYFFIILFDNRKIGLIQGKDVDFEKRECEGGIYLWENSLWMTGIASKASICFADLTFLISRLDRVYAKVRPDNISAYNYNYSLGYRPCKNYGDDFMVLTKKNYLEKAPRLRKIAAGPKGDASPLSIDDIEFNDIEQNFRLYSGLPSDVLDIIKPKLSYK